MDRNLYICCQAPGTSTLVLSLQTQADTYSGYLVCLARNPLPLIFQDVTIKGLSALLLSTFIFVSTARASVNNLFFPLTTCLFCFLKKQMTEVSRMAVNWLLHPYHTAEYGPTSASHLPYSIPCPQEASIHIHKESGMFWWKFHPKPHLPSLYKPCYISETPANNDLLPRDAQDYSTGYLNCPQKTDKWLSGLLFPSLS